MENEKNKKNEKIKSFLKEIEVRSREYHTEYMKKAYNTKFKKNIIDGLLLTITPTSGILAFTEQFTFDFIPYIVGGLNCLCSFIIVLGRHFDYSGNHSSFKKAQEIFFDIEMEIKKQLILDLKEEDLKKFSDEIEKRFNSAIKTSPEIIVPKDYEIDMNKYSNIDNIFNV